MTAMIEKYRIKPVVDTVYSFDHAVEAYRAFERGNHFGKIVIALDDGNVASIGGR
jgi:NADPH:quinone reductase-like Zn-dependent oxidoreductase